MPYLFVQHNTQGLTQAQALLGHSDPKLTASLYTHLDASDLRDAVERMESA